MDERKSRFILPLVFSITGLALTVRTVIEFSGRIAIRRPSYDLIHIVAGSTQSDALVLLEILIPVYLIEFLILTVPLAYLFLAVNKLLKSTAYTQSVMKLGTRFGSSRMIRRAVMPALFALSFGDALLSLVDGWPFSSFVFAPSDVDFFQNTVDPLLSILTALTVMPLGLLFFMPTWALDDAGIVSHLKSEQLENRRCPDTEGVGRWYSGFVSGFAVIGFPILMVYRYFYRPFFVLGLPVNGITVFMSIFTTLGLPLLIMSIVLVVIMLNEIVVRSMIRPVQGLAKRLGAKVVERERILPEMQERTPG